MKKKIEELVKVEVLAKHYAPQSLDDLMNSIFNEGLKERPVINCNNEIVHGHRRIAAISALGLTEVEVVVEDVQHNAQLRQNTGRLPAVHDAKRENPAHCNPISPWHARRDHAVLRGSSLVRIHCCGPPSKRGCET